MPFRGCLGPVSMSQGLCDTTSWPQNPTAIDARDPNEFNRPPNTFGDIYGPRPYKFIRFGTIYGPKHYTSINFVDIYGPKPYKFMYGLPRVSLHTQRPGG